METSIGVNNFPTVASGTPIGAPMYALMAMRPPDTYTNNTVTLESLQRDLARATHLSIQAEVDWEVALPRVKIVDQNGILGDLVSGCVPADNNLL